MQLRYRTNRLQPLSISSKLRRLRSNGVHEKGYFWSRIMSTSLRDQELFMTDLFPVLIPLPIKEIQSQQPRSKVSCFVARK
jgi:hypothetical protein